MYVCVLFSIVFYIFNLILLALMSLFSMTFNTGLKDKDFVNLYFYIEVYFTLRKRRVRIVLESLMLIGFNSSFTILT